jgi:glutamate synthase (NADPH/NADH) small chain
VADPRGFLRIPHVHAPKRPPEQRVRDHKMIFELMPVGEVGRQARRCMDCGVPFCQDGCPVGNRIPRWNDLVGSDRWREALDQLHATNDFPEFTGYICPAPCESACVLAINSEPVTIKQVELEIIERGWREGWVRPRPPRSRTGRRVAVVGSGPAGLAAAAQLNARGHTVTVYERSEAPGGLMRIGVPDFKLAKWVIDRRIGVLEAEGIEFRCGVEVGTDLDPGEVRAGQDAVVLTVGALRERPLDVPGAGLGGVHFAMEYLAGHNRLVARTRGRPEDDCGGAPVTATGKRVAVIGGGDTAADCIATALREGAAEVRQLDRYPRPDGSHTRELADWPAMPRRMPTTYALEEGGTRRFAEAVIQLTETDGQVSRLHGTALDGPPDFTPRPGSEFDQPVDLVLVAVGFLGPERRVLDALGPGEASEPGAGEPAGADGDHVHAPGVFLAGDARLGASLVVTAIDDGRRCAAVVDRYLRMSASPPALAG